MTPFKKTILEWLGYSRRERRSTLILLVILLIVISVNYLVPSNDPGPEDLSSLLVVPDSIKENNPVIFSDTTVHFHFDPNSASFDTLVDIGLTEKQARTIISYRNKGGRFKMPDDLKKIYGIDEMTSERLIPLITIQKSTRVTRSFSSDSILSRNSTAMIDLNRTDSSSLEKLPGLGRVLSSRIIKYRKILGGYTSVEQLKEVYGLQEETYNLLAGKLFADTSLIKRIDINRASLKELSKHPYLDRNDIQAIAKYRELKGIISNSGELIDNKVLTPYKTKKISPYLKF
jgi:competence protein ComEA